MTLPAPITAVLADGAVPAHPAPLSLFAAAAHLVCCDGAALKARALGRVPDLVVGDGDSLPAADMASLGARFSRVAEQDTNDLSKAFRAAVARFGGEGVVILGADGLREDHLIGNVFLLADFARDAPDVSLVTNAGLFTVACGERSYRCRPGSAVSVFATSSGARMESQGLAWPLKGVALDSLWRGTLNRADGDGFTLRTNSPVVVYQPLDGVWGGPPSRAIVSLGSNIEPRARYLAMARAALSELPGTRIAKASEVEETEPVDVPPEFRHMKFLNQLLVLETALDPIGFSRRMHAIEAAIGRVRTVRNGPRTIDIDLIDFDGIKMDTPELTLPHPRAASRDFVMRPLSLLI